jgi:hypothetical protein
VLVFIDESGDVGLPGASPLFTLTLVLFEDRKEATRAQTALSLLLRQTNLAEFKFSDLHRKGRHEYFIAVRDFSFRYYSLVFNKSRLGPEFRKGEQFYRSACHLLCGKAAHVLHEATVVIDGSGSKQSQRELSTYLRKKVNGNGGRFIREVMLEDSKKNSLVQLADMVCGAVARSFSQKTGSDQYRLAIKHLEAEVCCWP